MFEFLLIISSYINIFIFIFSYDGCYKKFFFTVALHAFYVNRLIMRQNARKNTISRQKTYKFCGNGAQPSPQTPPVVQSRGTPLPQNIFGNAVTPNNIRTMGNSDK